MLGSLIVPLTNTLRPHFALNKTRLATLSILLVGLANCPTVNLSHLASGSLSQPLNVARNILCRIGQGPKPD